MKEVLAQREITVILKGPEALVDRVAAQLVENLPTGMCVGEVRWSIAQRKDWLDVEWNVIPPADIIAAIRAVKP